MEFDSMSASMESDSMLYLIELERERLEERTFDEAEFVVNGRTYTARQRRRQRPASPPPDPETLMRTWLPTPAYYLPRERSSSPQAHAAGAGARGSKRGRVPASDEAMLGLRVVTDSESSGECAICLRDLADPDVTPTIRAMPCSHAFHQRCIFEWLRRNAVCPLCRFQLPTEEEEEEEDTGGAGETEIEEHGEDRRRTAVSFEHYRRTRRVPFSS